MYYYSTTILQYYGRQRRVIGSWKMYKDWCRCCCFSCCCGCCCCGCCRLTHFPNSLTHFSKLSREAAVAALRRWRRRPMPDPSKRSPRQILCTVTTFGVPPPRKILCACQPVRIILETSVFACMKSKELASVFVQTVCRKSIFASQCIGFAIGIVKVRFYFYGRAARFAKALEPSPSWHRQEAFHHRRTGAGTGSRETSAVVAHQLPQMTAIVILLTRIIIICPRSVYNFKSSSFQAVKLSSL